MARITAELNQIFWTDRAPELARDHFRSPDAIAANYGGLERWEDLGDGAIQFFLPKKNHGITTFEGRYTCVWCPEGPATLVWHTPDEPGTNLWSSGRAVFTVQGPRTRIDYHQKTAIELDVGRLVARALRPVVTTMMNRELQSYVRRMIASIP